MTRMRSSLPLIVLLLALPASLYAQTWSGSGSNGSDGALSLTFETPGVVGTELIFDPVALNLDVDGDNVYHFTTVSIAQGIVVRLVPQKLRRNGPIVWLATGLVDIGGVLFLQGDPGHPGGSDYSLRRPAAPGPGGYPGGVGGGVGIAASPGFGPGGALPPTGEQNLGCNAGHVAGGTAHPNNTGCVGKTGSTYGTAFLQPLVGGSGGSGAVCAVPDQFGGGGGGGGGAIRISTDGQIQLSANQNGIFAYGGDASFGCTTGGGGSGGSIHLQGGLGVAFVSNNRLHAYGGLDATGIRASDGRIRIDTPTGTLLVASLQTDPPAPVGFLVDIPLPVIPTIQITSVDGVAVPPSPKGQYTIPDLSINKTTPVTVDISATDIPLGTQLTLIITAEGGSEPDQVVTTSALAGTVANSTAAATVTFPPNVVRFFARAVW